LYFHSALHWTIAIGMRSSLKDNPIDDGGGREPYPERSLSAHVIGNDAGMLRSGFFG